MFSAIYIEEEVLDTERVRSILASYPDLPQIICQRYGEIFNRKAQNFRLQKKAPALILARKHGKLVLPAPAGYGFKGGESFYFSHMLNCVYDCRYCFLQGMYRSANYVLFVNYEDFSAELERNIESCDGPSVYYSGYDCDSLALEPVSHFCEYFIPVFRRNPDARLEIRTKSTQVRSLLDMRPADNCIIAMSFTAHEAAKQWEHKVPSIEKRIEALCKLQQAGWPVAVRFEPIIAEPGVVENYECLFRQLFARLDGDALHSVSIGEFRMPTEFHKSIVKQYPDSALYARAMITSDGMVSIKQPQTVDVLGQIEQSLFGFISPDLYYRCA